MDVTIAHPGGVTEIPEERFLYGLIAEFEEPDQIVAAARQVHDAGYRRIDAYTPYPVEDLPEALGFHDQWVPFLMLAGGLCGCIFGFCLLYYCLILSYPMNVGGQPLFAWPVWVAITFECTVLFTALTGFVAMLAINGLPQPYHPVFDAPRFELATSSRFFLCIEARDPHFDREETRRFMDTLGAVHVSEVELKK